MCKSAELFMDNTAAAASGYPPVANDDAYKEIFEQAENFKKYQGASKSWWYGPTCSRSIVKSRQVRKLELTVYFTSKNKKALLNKA